MTTENTATATTDERRARIDAEREDRRREDRAREDTWRTRVPVACPRCRVVLDVPADVTEVDMREADPHAIRVRFREAHVTHRCGYPDETTD